MLYTIAAILIVLWLLGIVTSNTLGGFIYILLIIAVIMILVRLIRGENLAIRRQRGDRSGISYSLEGLAVVVASLGDSLRASCIWDAAERSRAEIGTPYRAA